MKIRRFFRQLHRWLGLLVAAQLLLWVIGGLVMSVLRLEEVRGEDRAAQKAAVSLPSDPTLLAPARVIGAHEGAPVTGLALVMLDSRPVYRHRRECAAVPGNRPFYAGFFVPPGGAALNRGHGSSIGTRARYSR